MTKKEMEIIREIHLRYIRKHTEAEGKEHRFFKRLHEQQLRSFCGNNAVKTCGRGCGFCPHIETDRKERKQSL